MTARILCLVIGYAFGLLQTSYLLGKIAGIDIRKKGSGNAGTTNAIRTLGLKAGAITFFCDILKCVLAVLVTWIIFRKTNADIVPLLKIWTSAGVVLGHVFPFYMKFKGGKGIAAMGGMMIAFGDIRLILILIAVFFGLFFLTHMVSISSLCLTTVWMLAMAVGGILGTYGMQPPARVELFLIVFGLTFLGFYEHRENILRLLQGTERKTYLTKRSDQ